MQSDIIKRAEDWLAEWQANCEKYGIATDDKEATACYVIIQDLLKALRSAPMTNSPKDIDEAGLEAANKAFAKHILDKKGMPYKAEEAIEAAIQAYLAAVKPRIEVDNLGGALEDIIRQLESRSKLADKEYREHKDYFQDGLAAGLNEGKLLIQAALTPQPTADTNQQPSTKE